MKYYYDCCDVCEKKVRDYNVITNFGTDGNPITCCPECDKTLPRVDEEDE